RILRRRSTRLRQIANPHARGYARTIAMGFTFLEPGPLVDAELELVAPDVRWVDPLMKSCAHPQCADDPAATSTTRQHVMDFLKSAPRGHQPADASFGRVPAYHFWMRLR